MGARGRLALVALAGLALAALMWLARAERASATAPVRAELRAAPELAAVDGLGSRASPRREDDDAPSTRAAAEERAAPAGSLLRARGRVIGEDGAPLPGVDVVLSAQGRWSSAAAVPALALDGGREGYALRTDADGTFLVEAPAPTAEELVLELAAGDLLTTQRVVFGGIRSDARRALGPGDLDLGTFELAPAGVLVGRVTDELGAPVAGARVRAALGDLSPTLDSAVTDASGAYRLAHLPPQGVEVRVEAEGFRDGIAKSVRAEPSAELSRRDFALVSAPTITGVVVDEQGVPLAGAKISLQAWEPCGPDAPGGWAHAESDAHGRFLATLRNECRHGLRVRLDGYSPFRLGRPVRQGEPELRVELRELPGIALQVVDAATGRPIERYALHEPVESGYAILNPPRPDYASHPQGTTVVRARPGEAEFVVLAPGYHGRRWRPSSEESVLALTPGPRVRGRVLREGAIVERPAIAFAGTSRMSNLDQPRTVTRGWVVGLESGAFEVPLPAGGTYDLELYGEGPAPTRLGVEVPEEGELDLGDVELRAGASVSGRVVLPPFVPLQGLEVRASDPARWRSATTNARGEFRLHDLPSGTIELRVQGHLLEWTSGDATALELAPGEQRTIVLEPSSDRLLAEVAARVRCGGRPAAYTEVTLASERDPRGRVVGVTDAQGVVTGCVKACEQGRFRVQGAPGIGVPAVGGPVSLPCCKNEVEVELDAGWLELVWSAEPDATAITISLAPEDGEGGAKFGYERVPDHLRLGLVPVGRYRVTLWHTRTTRTPGARTVWGRVGPELSGTAVVEVGEVSTCVLAP